MRFQHALLQKLFRQVSLYQLGGISINENFVLVLILLTVLCTPAFGQTTSTDWIKGAENPTSYSIKSSVTQTLMLFDKGANAASEKVATVTETTDTVAVLNLSSLEAHASRSTKNQMEMQGQPAKTNTTYVDFYQIGNSTYKKNECGNWTHLVDPRPEQDVWEGMDENNLVNVIAETFNLTSRIK